jgi:hypothetical protein
VGKHGFLGVIFLIAALLYKITVLLLECHSQFARGLSHLVVVQLGLDIVTTRVSITLYIMKLLALGKYFAFCRPMRPPIKKWSSTTLVALDEVYNLIIGIRHFVYVFPVLDHYHSCPKKGIVGSNHFCACNLWDNKV